MNVFLARLISLVKAFIIDLIWGYTSHSHFEHMHYHFVFGPMTRCLLDPSIDTLSLRIDPYFIFNPQGTLPSLRIDYNFGLVNKSSLLKERSSLLLVDPFISLTFP